MIPRFKDADGEYEVVLFCLACGWAIPKDQVTAKWQQCILCKGKLETRRFDYKPSYIKAHKGMVPE